METPITQTAAPIQSYISGVFFINELSPQHRQKQQIRRHMLHKRDQMKGSSATLAGLGILGACALCCALPLLGGAAVLGISSFFFNPVVIVILALILIALAIVIYQRRKVNGSSCMKSGCSCTSCSSGRG